MTPPQPPGRMGSGPRPSLEHSLRSPQALSAETSAMLEVFREEMDRRESRLALRLQTAAKAEQSAELTMAIRGQRRNKGLAVTFGTALGLAALAFSTAWGVYRDARATAIDVAVEAKTTTETLEQRVDAQTQRQDKTSLALTELTQDVDNIGKAVTKLVTMLEQPTPVVVPAPKKGRQR